MRWLTGCKRKTAIRPRRRERWSVPGDWVNNSRSLAFQQPAAVRGGISAVSVELVGAAGLCLAVIFSLSGCDAPAPSPNSVKPVAGGSPETPAHKPLPPIASGHAEPRPGRLPRFRDVTSEAGVDFSRYDSQTGLHRMMEALGGGVALVDVDNDGALDIFFTNGCELPLSTNDRTHHLALFRNTGRLKYAPIAGPSGIEQWHGYFTGCTVGDLEGDGFDDLFLAAFGPDLLLHNNGDGTFSDITSIAGVGSDLWGSSPAFADLNQDGNLDLLVVNYVHASDQAQDLCPNPKSPDGYIQCSPWMFQAAPDELFLSAGDGSFRAVASEVGLTAPDGKGLGVVICDFDRDGDQDIFIANDTTPNFLYRNRGIERVGGESLPRFDEVAVELGCALSFDGQAQACMGVASGDFDRDGWRDLFVTNFHSETNTLYRNHAGAFFVDETPQSGLGPPSREMLGFGTEFLDYDNNGLLDLFVANGHIDDFEWQSPPQPYRMLPQVFRNEGRAFTEVTSEAGPYFRSKRIGRGLAVGDLDDDGLLDLVISHQRDPSVVLHNETDPHDQSLIIKLVGTKRSSRSGFGAKVTVEINGVTASSEVIGGGSFESASDCRVHFGLGTAKGISLLQVIWPSGEQQEWKDVSAGHYLVVEGRPGVLPKISSTGSPDDNPAAAPLSP